MVCSAFEVATWSVTLSDRCAILPWRTPGDARVAETRDKNGRGYLGRRHEPQYNRVRSKQSASLEDKSQGRQRPERQLPRGRRGHCFHGGRRDVPPSSPVWSCCQRASFLGFLWVSLTKQDLGMTRDCFSSVHHLWSHRKLFDDVCFKMPIAVRWPRISAKTKQQVTCQGLGPLGQNVSRVMAGGNYLICNPPSVSA